MTFYVVVFICLILLRYFLQHKPRARVQMYPLVLCALFLFAAFRFEVGCDWSGYFYQYKAQSYSTFDKALMQLEPLWWVLMEGMQRLELAYPWVNVLSSGIFFLGIHVLARRQADPLGFLVLLFPVLIINLPMSGIRQGAAIGIICIAFVAFMDKRLLRFVTLTLLASTIHSSAIVFLLLAPLVQGEFTKKRLASAAVLAVPGTLILLSGEAAQLATSRYVGTGLDALGAAFRVGLLLVTGVAYFWILRGKWRQAFPEDYKLVSVGALLMLGMLVLLPMSTVIGDRLGYYLVPIQTMIFARIPYLPIRRSKAFYSSAPYLGLALMFIIWVYFSWHFNKCYVPYDSWLFGMPDHSKYRF